MNYFERVLELTPTKFWVNNVTRRQAKLGIDNGALGCTQNPSYVWKMLSNDEEKDYAMDVLRSTLSYSDDDNQVACELQRKLIKGVSDIFMPLWEASGGKYGYVSIQGDPIHEEDWHVIVEEGRKNRALNPNIMIKIPATDAGLRATEILMEENTPINATEVMGVDQVLALGEIYKKVSYGRKEVAPMYFSLITGIYNEWLRKEIAAQGTEINPDVLHQAGMAVAKKVYEMNISRGYNMGFISGGARTLDDFYEMVGGNVNVTMNWKGSCDELIAADKPVISRLFNPIQHDVIDQLNRLPEFRSAYWEGGLKRDEFEGYGPVMYFRNGFISSWKKELEVIGQERNR